MAEAIKYKDHAVVYGNGKGKDAAYINESFKGILRLSPNSSGTYNNASTSIGSGYTAFQDAISDALKEQYISVSTSDGILLDMRINTEGAEYTNLNVLGNVYGEKVELYIKNFKFNLGKNIEMPIAINTLVDASLNTLDSYSYKEVDNKNVDSTYILVNESTNKRKFVYKNANDIIDLFINKKLLEVNIVPTGSIHFVPISPAKYKELKMTGEHNSSADGVDSLIRDFLPCDGKLYDAVMFPELAKILQGTEVIYWDANGNRKRYKNGETPGKFRVPDLRGQFIRSINNMGIKSSATNEVGTWEIDSIVDMTDALIKAEKRGDTHYHYITLDSFVDSTNQQPNNNCFTYSTQSGVTSGMAAPMARLGNITARQLGEDVNCSWGKCNDHGFSDKFATSPIKKGGTRWYSSSNPPAGHCTKINTSFGATCGYILSVAPSYNCETRKLDNGISWVGLSSGTIPQETTDVSWSNLNYTKYRSSVLETSQKTFRESSSLHGLENTPEFYGMMPFIKI